MIDRGPYGEPMNNVGVMSTASDRAKLEVVYIMCTFWDVVGTHCLQANTIG